MIWIVEINSHHAFDMKSVQQWIGRVVEPCISSEMIVDIALPELSRKMDTPVVDMSREPESIIKAADMTHDCLNKLSSLISKGRMDFGFGYRIQFFGLSYLIRNLL